MLLNRSVNDESLVCVSTPLKSSTSNNFEQVEIKTTKFAFEMDLEREMQSVHNFFLENLYTLMGWKMALEMEHKDLLKKFRTIFSLNLSQMDDESTMKTSRKTGENATTASALPLQEMFPEAVCFLNSIFMNSYLFKGVKGIKRI